jgi:Asp-tRNA(Asn)/Glu-tRNA(Gln) amidotransferase A subunit family amidase
LKCETIQDLLDGQFKGTFSCKQVITVACERAYRIGRKHNLTADECFEEALKVAEDRDRELQDCLMAKEDPYKTLGTLHGIPFSVKDQIQLKGYTCTMGVGSRADTVVDTDANFVKVCKDQGGVPVVKGNTPVLCFSLHSTNRIWGTAENQWNNKRSCAGSSGGDASLLGCVQFSMGSDLGGSLRVPASFNGVNTFLPTANRQLPDGNHMYSVSKSWAVNPLKGVIGPFSKNVDDIVRIMQLYFSDKKLKMDFLDSKLVFDNDLFQKTLKSRGMRFGVIANYDATLGLCPTAKRVLDEASEHLKSLGHQVIEIDIPDIDEQLQNQVKIVINTYIPFCVEEWNDKCDDIAGLTAMLTLYSGTPIIPKILSQVLKLAGQRRVSKTIEMLRNLDTGNQFLI